MKNTLIILTSTIMISFLVACGGEKTADKKKAELESLKTKQTEIAAQIATIQDEIIAMGDSTNQEDDRSKVIALTAVTKQNFIHAIDVQGRVDGDENLTYSAKVPAAVVKINVKVGQRVKAGQILAELDAKPIKAQLAAAQKQAELAITTYERRKELWDQKVGSEIEFLQAKNAKENAEKGIETLNQQLDMYYIKADYNGTIDEIKLKVGQNVAPGVPCITVVNPDKLKVKASLSESYAGLIKIGNSVTLYFPDLQKTVTSKVGYASKTISEMTRTFDIEINLPTDESLYPNMVSQVQIVDYSKANAIVVPINAIQQIDGEEIVFVAIKQADKLIAKKIAVKTGKQYNGLSEILSGLNEGDNVISVGFQDLTDGQTVKL